MARLAPTSAGANIAGIICWTNVGANNNIVVVDAVLLAVNMPPTPYQHAP